MPLKASPTTPQHRSPIRKQRKGISLHQKQALIDNLQLESRTPEFYARAPLQSRPC